MCVHAVVEEEAAGEKDISSEIKILLMIKREITAQVLLMMIDLEMMKMC